MGLLGTGAVAIWHDIAPQGRAEFYAWHGREHMPERVAIPGFRRGRRYIALDADLEFFNLYETDSPAVLTGAAYRARLNAPSPWTQATVRHFRGVARSLCRVISSSGGAQGGLVATWRYDLASADRNGHAEALRQLLAALDAVDLVAGVHLLAADPGASAEANAEEEARAEPNRVPGWVVLAEGWGDAGDFVAHCRQAMPAPRLVEIGAAAPVACGIYQLQAVVAESDLG